MSIESSLPRHPAIVILARFMFTLIFFLSGTTHFTDMSGYVELIHESIPFREFWVATSGTVELAGASLILFDRHARIGGWLLVLFLVPVTITVHGVAMVSAEDPVTRGIQLSFFLKGIAMAGCALLITQLGARSSDA